MSITYCKQQYHGYADMTIKDDGENASTQEYSLNRTEIKGWSLGQII